MLFAVECECVVAYDVLCIHVGVDEADIVYCMENLVDEVSPVQVHISLYMNMRYYHVRMLSPVQDDAEEREAEFILNCSEKFNKVEIIIYSAFTIKYENCVCVCVCV